MKEYNVGKHSATVERTEKHVRSQSKDEPLAERTGTVGTVAKVIRLIAELTLVAALVALYLYAFTDVFTKPDVTVTYYTPDGSFTQTDIFSGSEIELAEGPEIDGYTFIGWRNAEGSLETDATVKIFENTSFSAVYSFALETEEHVPYMLLDKDAYFRPNDIFTRREAAIMIYRLLNTDKVGTGSFTDVEKNDSCYTATATLKDLGIIGGSRFHPDDPVTLGELLEMLCAFYPVSSKEYTFADIDASNSYYSAFCTAADLGWIKSGENENATPDLEMTRMEAATFINSILGRTGDSKDDHSLSGTFFDVSFDNEHFWDAAEACLEHEYEETNGKESWVSSEGLELREPGRFFVGVKLYYADEDGGVVTDTEIDGLYYGSDGCYTSGDEELDAVVWSVLSEIVDPQTMDREEMLRICFDYCVKSFKYKAKGLHEIGETGWGNQAAYEMLTEKKGNCYYFAGAFWAMARAIGYDATLYSGYVTKRQHGWVEIDFDGEPYIFDPEIQYLYSSKAPEDYMYKKSYESAKGWSYVRAKS